MASSCRTPSDLNRWLSFHVVRTGTAERQLLMVRDVSREQQLQSMRKDFVANASHELRSPLTVITGYLDALADDQKLDPTWSAPILEMRRQAERMSTIINDLLELSKLESGEHPLEEERRRHPGHAGAAAQGNAGARASPARSAADARQRRDGSKAWKASCTPSSRTCCPTR